MTRQPDWSDLRGQAHLPAAVLVQLPDGSMVAIWGTSEFVTQYMDRRDDRREVEFEWRDDGSPPEYGVDVRWHRGYTMTWWTGPMPDGPPALNPPRLELPR